MKPIRHLIAALVALLIATPALAYSPPAIGAGRTNALNFDCGITIGDGSTHTVGTAPVGSCFYGKTTLAQIAAIQINGQKPFWFLTDSGTLTGPLGTLGSTTNPFTSSTGAYALTDAKATSLDIAWLAIQAAILTNPIGAAYIPAGTYVIGSAIPLPIMLPMHFDGTTSGNTTYQTLVTGDGSESTILQAGSSFGTLAESGSPSWFTNIPLMSCGDPGATPTNNLGRWNGNNGQCAGTVEHIGLNGSSSLTSSGPASTYRTDGFALGARLYLTDVTSNNFYRDLTFTGDHTLYDRVHANAGVIGAYWTKPNSVLTGDFQFIDFSAAGQSYVSVEIDGNATISGVAFEGETYVNANYYAFFGDANSCSDMLYDVAFTKLMTEYTGLGFFHDDHVFNSANGVYTDTAKCRGMGNVSTKIWVAEFDNTRIPTAVTTATYPRRRRAAVDVGNFAGDFQGLDPNTGGAGSFIPSPDNIGYAGVAVFNINQIGSTSYQTGTNFAGPMQQLFQEGVGVGLSFVAGTGGTAGTYTVVATGGGCATEPSIQVTIGGSGGISSIAPTLSAGEPILASQCTSLPTYALSGISGLTGASVTAASIPWLPPGVSSFGASGAGEIGIGAKWESRGSNSGIFARFTPTALTGSNYTATTVADVMEWYQYSIGQIAPGGFTPSQPAMGIAEEAGLTAGQVVPLQTTGIAYIRQGFASSTDGYQMKSSGIGPVSFVAGTGASAAGTTTITATGGGCTTEPSLAVTVGTAGGGITSVAAGSSSGAGCTSNPSWSLSSIAGLTGASITSIWPSAGMTSASSIAAGIIVGFDLHAAANYGLSNQQELCRLLWLQ